MGGGSWTKSAFTTYSTATYGAVLDSKGEIINNVSNQDIFKSRSVQPELNPKDVMRECRDSEEHPNTLPVILALDVTGSMGQAAVEVAKQLNVLMESLYSEVKDVEFLIMGVGDLVYDDAPIQISQFESDIRIVKQLDKVYFEFGGGGNSYESYTAAWYMAAYHTDLDCWNRGYKGILITMGDEELNPRLPLSTLSELTGDAQVKEADLETPALFEKVSQKYDVYHIDVQHGRKYEDQLIPDSWGILGQNFSRATLKTITDKIASIIKERAKAEPTEISAVSTGGEISW